MMRSRLVDFLSEDAGDSLIEFTLCVTVVLTVVFGIMDISRAVYTEHFVAVVARQAVRYAAVRGSTFAGVSCATVSTANCAATAGNVTRFVKNLEPAGTSTANVAVVTTWPGQDGSGAVCVNAVKTATSPGCVVNVKVTYAYHFFLPFLPKDLMTMASSSSMTIAE
jgi:Flp pilus assembly protein TadG